MPSPKYNVNSDSFSSTSLPFSRSHKKSTSKLYKPNKKTGIYYQQTSSKEKVDPKQWIIRLLFFLLICYFIIQYISSPNTNELTTEYIPELTIAQKYQPVLSSSSAHSLHPRIPKIVHFVYGLKGPEPTLDLIHYLSIKSAHDRLQPDTIMFHYHYLPTGELFEKAKPYLTLHQVDLVPEIFGQPISHFAHQADIIRLDVLNEYGGIYLDMDVISLKSLDDLLDYDFVMGQEGIDGSIGLCNAVILSKPGSAFLQRWKQTYQTFNQNDWNYHSVILPGKLAPYFKNEIHVMNHTSFFWPLWDSNGLRTLFLEKSYPFHQGNYLTHIWESAATPHLMHGLSTDLIKHIDNSLYCQLRFFLNNDSVDEPIQPCQHMEHSEREDRLIGHWPLKKYLNKQINPTPALDASGNGMHGILRNGYYYLNENQNDDGAYVNGKDSYLFLSMPTNMSLEENGLTIHWLMKTSSEKENGTVIMIQADTYQLHIKTQKIPTMADISSSSNEKKKDLLSLAIDTYILVDGWQWSYQPNLSVSSSIIPINQEDRYSQYTLVVQKNRNKDDKDNVNGSALTPNLVLYKDGYVMASHSHWQPYFDRLLEQQQQQKEKELEKEKELQEMKSIIRGIWLGSREPSKYQDAWDIRPSLDAWFKDISVWETALDLSFIKDHILSKDIKNSMENMNSNNNNNGLFNTVFNNAPDQGTKLENDPSDTDNIYFNDNNDNDNNNNNNANGDATVIENELEE